MAHKRQNDSLFLWLFVGIYLVLGLLANEVYDIADIDFEPGEGAIDFPVLAVLVERAKEVPTLVTIVAGIVAGIRGLVRQKNRE